MNNPLLIFYTIFDNKLKLMIVLNLLRNERMSFNELLWETDSLEELLERALYELQRLNIISESYERIEIQYELTAIGYEIYKIEQEIIRWIDEYPTYV